MKRLFALVLALALLAGGGVIAVRLAHPRVMFAWAEDAASTHGNALWHIVHDLCTPDMVASGNPAPCVSVDLKRGYAVLKDIQGKTQYLLIPTTKVTGIESPELLEPGSPNYWAAAWDARKLVEDRIGHPVPREDIGLAVNSVNGRTQNQLHIHIDCIGEDVRDALKQQSPHIGAEWTPVSLGFHHHYHALWLAGAELGDRDPFKILARTAPAARANMGAETLALIGGTRADGEPGFFLLSDPADGAPSDLATAEELQDHGCGVANDGQGAARSN